MPTTFDIDALIKELELDKEDIVELIEDFREYLPPAIKELEDAIAQGDLQASRSAAHSIKGSAGNLRVQAVYECAKKMQDEADAGNSDALAPLLEQIKKDADAFMQESSEL